MDSILTDKPSGPHSNLAQTMRTPLGINSARIHRGSLARSSQQPLLMTSQTGPQTVYSRIAPRVLTSLAPA